MENQKQHTLNEILTNDPLGILDEPVDVGNGRWYTLHIYESTNNDGSIRCSYDFKTKVAGVDSMVLVYDSRGIRIMVTTDTRNSQKMGEFVSISDGLDELCRRCGVKNYTTKRICCDY